MAKLSFVLDGGEEKTYKLNPHTSFRIGRDPANDVVLRDPKVSRQHAEVVFERGFFVLHDLQSSNGTYVNGKRIRVAPLTHDSELRVGNTIGHFVEEFTADPRATVSAEMPKSDSDSSRKPEHSRHADAVNLAGNNSSPRTIHEDLLPVAEEWREEGFEQSRYLVDRNVPYGECVVIRSADSTPRFYLPRTFNWTIFAAAIVGGIVTLAGATVITFLLLDRRFLAAIAATSLTLAFVLILRRLLPRRVLRLWNDEKLTRIALVLEQERRFPAGATFVSRAADGSVVGYVKKNSPFAPGRRQWTLFDRSGVVEVARAVETSLSRAILRKFLGSFFGRLRNDYAIQGNRGSGMLTRGSDGPHDVLDLASDPSAAVDRRLAVALLVAIYSFERT